MRRLSRRMPHGRHYRDRRRLAFFARGAATRCTAPVAQALRPVARRPSRGAAARCTASAAHSVSIASRALDRVRPKTGFRRSFAAPPARRPPATAPRATASARRRPRATASFSRCFRLPHKRCSSSADAERRSNCPVVRRRKALEFGVPLEPFEQYAHAAEISNHLEPSASKQPSSKPNPCSTPYEGKVT